MFDKSPLRIAIASLLIAPVCVQAEVEVSAELTNETAVYLKDGAVTGAGASMLNDRAHDSGELMKFENAARIFINGDAGESSTFHVELRPVYDTEGVSGYKGHKNFSQHDYLREAYLDSRAGDWYLRLGKQQVVWGTADGIKLLDIINPTDFRELNQNAVEDARIPIWMVNAERNFDNGGNVQVIVSQAEENKYPGLEPGGAPGQPFVAKGVDSISGPVNGFYSITPALSKVAASFNAAAVGGGLGPASPAGLVPFAGFTVDGFASSPFMGGPGYFGLNGLAQNGLFMGDPNGNNNVTNLMSVTGPLPTDVTWAPENPKSAFEYMANATFATFNTFTRADATSPTGFNGIQTTWKQDYEVGPNLGGRYRNSLDNGLNFSLNYFYHYSANPAMDLSWRDTNTGETLEVVRAATVPMGPAAFPDPSVNLSREQALANQAIGNPTTILLRNQAGQYYGAFDPTSGAPNANTNPAELHFREYSDRVHSFGTSFDYATEFGELPVVLRGEFLYDKGEKQPVVDRYLLSIGDLTNALRMEEADYFKYVLGVDVTVLTNLLVSTQFIQFRNLDYVDQGASCTTQGMRTVDCSRYTADFATLHLSNGLNRAEENKEFYSLFLSKPFGENQLGRVNNIIIYEENDGWWNRLNAEYSLSDQLIVTGEINYYWGSEDTLFGQFKNSSSVQVGLKYIIE